MNNLPPLRILRSVVAPALGVSLGALLAGVPIACAPDAPGTVEAPERVGKVAAPPVEAPPVVGEVAAPDPIVPVTPPSVVPEVNIEVVGTTVAEPPVVGKVRADPPPKVGVMRAPPPAGTRVASPPPAGTTVAPVRVGVAPQPGFAASARPANPTVVRRGTRRATDPVPFVRRVT